MTMHQPGDFIVVICALNEETAMQHELLSNFGNQIEWTIIGDARVRSGVGFIFNNSHLRRELGIYAKRDVRRDMYKMHVRSSKAVPRV